MAVSAKERKARRNQFKKSSPQGNDQGVNLPEGQYKLKIIKSTFGTDKKGDDYVLNTYKVVGGNEDFIGQKVKKFFYLKTDDQMGWFKGFYEKMGLGKLEDYEDVEDGTVAKRLKGITFEGASVPSKKEGYGNNLFENRLCSNGDAEDDNDDEDNDSDDAPILMYEKGVRVSAEIDDETYEGVIKKIKGEDAVVLFDDGEKLTLPLSELENIEEDEDDDEDEDEPEEDNEDEESEEDEDDDEEEEEDDDEDDDEDEDDEEEASAEVFHLPTLTETRGMKSDDIIEEIFEPLEIDSDDVEKIKPTALAIVKCHKDPTKLKAAEYKLIVKAFKIKIKKGLPAKNIMAKCFTKIDSYIE